MTKPRRYIALYRDPLAIPTTYAVVWADGSREALTAEQYDALWNHQPLPEATP
jgi:hypothetical protein